jgi:predicted acyl esterase
VPGQPVEVDLGIWPTGLRLRPGQQLVLEIAARPGGPLPPSPTVTGLPPVELPTRNAGIQTIHTGGERPSVLYVPIAVESVDQSRDVV